MLALLPITFLYKLQISWKRKIVLGMLLGLGVFAAVCAAIKVRHVRTQTTDADITWDTTSLLVWSTTEANVIIYAACLPTISDFLKRCFNSVISYMIPYLRFNRLSSLPGTRPTDKEIDHVKLASFTDQGPRNLHTKGRSWSDEVMVWPPIEARLNTERQQVS